LWEAGLVREVYEPINWCPSCKTGLANEDLEGNACERCGTIVEKKPLRQYSIEITKYAEKLLDGLEGLDWKESIKDLQRNWIGKSEGAEIDFKIKGKNFEDKFTIFTTRPDTLFGCTYCVLAPELKQVQDLLAGGQIENKPEVEKYIEEVKLKTEIERSAEGREKTGVELKGIKAVNPANGEEVPVFIADYVLATYGSGAIMAVPAHDERDFEFAKKYNIEIKKVVKSDSEDINTEYGELVNSGKFDGLESEEAKRSITEFVGGKMVTKYKLRDWVFARQRYWGEPFPLVHMMEKDENGNDVKKIYPVDESDLPVVLPEVENYEPTGTGESPLANIDSWVDVQGYVTESGTFKVLQEGELPPPTPPYKGGGQVLNAKRETNTMPQWAGSSWYWLRYMDPKNSQRFVGVEEEKYWGQVDMYLGGLEHATRHLIYGRFWHRFLYDIGAISTPEPFKRLEAVGLLMGEGGVKMSKRLGNVVNPDEVVETWGADTVRVYLSFMGAYHDTATWSSQNIIGVRRFLERVWAMQYKTSASAVLEEEDEILLNKTIKKVTEDNETLGFNTSVSALMILSNAFEKLDAVPDAAYETLLKLLAPLAPFMTDELWQLRPGLGSIHAATWPQYDQGKIQSKSATLAIQINGKVRGEMVVEFDASEESVLEMLKSTETYQKWVAESTPKKLVVVKNRLVSVVL
jgi:leucyl-tRNA synthetase